MSVAGAEIAFSPGFRWGTSILPGAPITFEDVMNATAITYPYVTVTEMTGAAIKSVLEDVCDNLFNPDPYYQQGGDMVRIGGMQYACEPGQPIGRRIGGMTLEGKPIDAQRRYKVASWAPVAEGASGQPVWDLVASYLREKKVVGPSPLNRPRLIGVGDDAGVSKDAS
ncbi:MAG: soxB, partial [Betaproteobacteria bacterium]|nr:soxB [Betaproteobacteria bacterium]